MLPTLRPASRKKNPILLLNDAIRSEAPVKLLHRRLSYIWSQLSLTLKVRLFKVGVWCNSKGLWTRWRCSPSYYLEMKADTSALSCCSAVIHSPDSSSSLNVLHWVEVGTLCRLVRVLSHILLERKAFHYGPGFKDDDLYAAALIFNSC